MKVEKTLVDETLGETEGARRATGVSSNVSPAARPPGAIGSDTEVEAKAQRRRFTAEYKRRIVREADRCTTSGAIGALLRREGLYSSVLSSWRAARDRGELEGLAPKQRGPKAVAPDPRDKRIAEQDREIGKWRRRAERAEALVEVQKKVAILLGTTLDSERF
ncbi:MAG: transposase [Deltaproteobacteria bacterium]|nr:transposase [Deltaproteobacteria bacterium]